MSITGSIPTYATAEVDFALQNQPNPARFFGRNGTSEPVELLSTNPLSANNSSWVSPNQLNDTLLNLVYAQWPDIFIEPTATNADSVSIFRTQSSDKLSPPYTLAQFIQGEPLNSTLLGQVEENFLISQIETNWQPEELAAWHLNSSYFGNQVFGIQAAARFYFGRDAVQLTLPEAAMLMGIPRNPDINPIDDPAGAKLQQEAMLESLLRANLISQEQFIAARFTPLDVNTDRFSNQQEIILERFLHSRLNQYFSPAEIATNGLNVVTTIDPSLQQDLSCLTDYYLNYLNNQGLIGEGECPEAVTLAGSDLFPTGQFNRADSILAIVLDPQSGEIIALNGAGDIAENPIGDPQQPAGAREIGGLLYPFVYLTALSQGHTLSSMVLDIIDGESDTPTGLGPIFLEEALTSNSPAAAEHVLGWTGLGATLKTMAEMGGRVFLPEEEIGYRPGESDGRLGLINLAHAYGVLANNGRRVGSQPFGRAQQSTILAQVENDRGDILYESSSPTDRAILPNELTWLINQTLDDHLLPNSQTAVKITAYGRQNQDEWTVGYMPNLVVAVWVGNVASAGESGATTEPVTPALWETIMLKAGENRATVTWAPPGNIVSLDVCWPSGLQPNGLCPTRQGLFIAGTEPVLFDTMYQEFLINSENGNLATSSTPSNRITPITVQVFPPEAEKWAIANGYQPPPNTYDSIRTENTTAGFSIISPLPFEELDQTIAIQIELAELNQFEYFRIAAYQGLSPGGLQILAEQVEPNRNLRNLDIPLTLPFQNSGLYTLLITGFRPDGSIDELSIPISVSLIDK